MTAIKDINPDGTKVKNGTLTVEVSLPVVPYTQPDDKTCGETAVLSMFNGFIGPDVSNPVREWSKKNAFKSTGYGTEAYGLGLLIYDILKDRKFYGKRVDVYANYNYSDYITGLERRGENVEMESLSKRVLDSMKGGGEGIGIHNGEGIDYNGILSKVRDGSYAIVNINYHWVLAYGVAKVYEDGKFKREILLFVNPAPNSGTVILSQQPSNEEVQKFISFNEKLTDMVDTPDREALAEAFRKGIVSQSELSNLEKGKFSAVVVSPENLSEYLKHHHSPV
ncbi:MAG: hypothetical protein ACP5MK_02575 [Candidatus Micrarchaeia archaeon]